LQLRGGFFNNQESEDKEAKDNHPMELENSRFHGGAFLI
jgi:hypothetical protein